MVITRYEDEERNRPIISVELTDEEVTLLVEMYITDILHLEKEVRNGFVRKVVDEFNNSFDPNHPRQGWQIGFESIIESDLCDEGLRGNRWSTGFAKEVRKLAAKL